MSLNNVVIITKNNCIYCNKAKQFFKMNDIDFCEKEIETDISREDVFRLYPNQKTIPIIIVNEEMIGGYDEFISWYFSR